MSARPAQEDFESRTLTRHGQRTCVRDLDRSVYIYMRALQAPDLKIEYREGLELGPGQYEVTFFDPDNRIPSLEVEFANSPHIRYASAQRDLRKLIRRRRTPDARVEQRRG